jgi:futalosine hydrolase
MRPLLVVTAVEAERVALRRTVTSTVDVVTVGVGAAAAAAGTAWRLALARAAGTPYRAVLSAGLGGGFAGRIPVGALAVATRSVAADLGAASADGFIPLDDLGFGSTTVDADRHLVAALTAALPDAVAGAVLTVNTVTGTADGARALLTRYPDAAAEGMEGYGVACAAVLAGAAYGELRAISNPVGPRERGAWRVDAALDALAAAGAALATLDV